MTDTAPPGASSPRAFGHRPTTVIAARGLARRYAAERRFKIYGVTAVFFAVCMLVILFANIISTAVPAFTQTMINMEVALDYERLGINKDEPVTEEVLLNADFRGVAREHYFALFPDVRKRRDKRALIETLSPGAEHQLRSAVLADPSLLGKTPVFQIHMSDDIDQLNKGRIDARLPETERRVNDKQIAWFKSLEERGLIETAFNTTFFTAVDSSEPELAGIWGAVVGSFHTMLVTLAISFPLGVLAAVYLEEFAPENRWTQIIEVNINNLAAVPSIVFGLLGLAVFIQFFGVPESSPVAGGMVLALMTLPTIIIAARSSLKAVPPSIREAAYGLGASPLQVTTHHVLPLAMPGILTGTIIGMAQALGETAPLLMIGMVAFIGDVPRGPLDPATVLPVQVYLWSDSPERAFVERTSAAIVVLLSFLIMMNAAAVVLRKRFERKW